MIVLIAQNTEPVETQLVFVTVTMPRAALLLVTLLVGVVFGTAIASRILPAEPGQVRDRDVSSVKKVKESA